MVISPPVVGCSFLGASQRDRHESPGKQPARVAFSRGTRREEPARQAGQFYTRYVGLGDSISIDEYAGGPGWGAISLFNRNKDGVYPRWRGKDLRSIYPGIAFHSLASDGATCNTVLEAQLPGLPPGGNDPTIVTLTIGGNDFLHALGPGGDIERGAVDDFRSNLEKILKALLERYSTCLIILGTIYDPTDGIGDLTMPEVDVQEAYALFRAFNEAILDLGKSYGAHIAGHPLTFSGARLPPRGSN